MLRSDRWRLVHCNFSSSIAKQIHLPIQFVVAKQIHLPIQFVFANLGCFSSQVLCNMAFFTIHSLNGFLIVQNSGKFLQNDYILVSKLISLTVHSNVNSTCSGTEKRTLAFVFDACHEDLLTNKCEKACFSPCHAAIIGKRSELHRADL